VAERIIQLPPLSDVIRAKHLVEVATRAHSQWGRLTHPSSGAGSGMAGMQPV